MLNISSIARQEKNKLHTDSAFIVLARIVPPASTGVSEICIAHNNEDIVWQGKLWQAFPFGIGDSKTDNTGSEPSIEFKVSNVSRTLTYLLEQAGGGVDSKVYIYVVNTAEIKGENQHSAGLADPTFTRASTAYADDGSVVAANVPRMSSKGLLIEEKTTNLIKNPNPKSLAEYTAGNENVTFNNGAYFGDNSVLRYVQLYRNTAPVVGSTYSISVLVKMDDLTQPILGDNAGSGDFCLITNNATGSFITDSVTNIGSNIYKIIAHYTATSTTNYPVAIYKYTGQSSRGFTVIGYWQLEQKSYATSYTDGTREVELFTVPSGALNSTQGTIEFDYTPVNKPNSAISGQPTSTKIFQIGNYYEPNSLTLWKFTSTRLVLYGFGATSTGESLVTGYSWQYELGTKYHFAVRWTNAAKFEVFLNHVKIIAGTSSDTFTSMGNLILGETNAAGGANAIYSNLRISNIARTDAELTIDTTPAVDEHTTYYMPLTDNLNFTAQAELEEQYTVGKTSVDENWVTFTLGAGYSLRTRRPFYRYMKNSCPFKYKGTRCACTSSEATCRHTLADCRARGNSKRYGGFPGIDQKGLYLE